MSLIISSSAVPLTVPGLKTSTEVTKTKVQAPIPVEVQPLVNQFHQLDERLAAVNKAVRELKEKMQYKEISASLKPVKESLFSYMQHNNIKQLGDIKLAAVKPSAIKKEEREEKLYNRVEQCLHHELGEQGLAVADTVVEAVLNK